MNDLENKDEIKEKIAKKIANNEFELVDVSDSKELDDTDVSIKVDTNSDFSNSSNVDSSNVVISDATSKATSNTTVNSNEGSSENDSEAKNKDSDNSNVFNEVGNIFSDNKYANSPKKSESLKEKPDDKNSNSSTPKNNTDSNKLKDDLKKAKEEIKPAIDEAKKVGNELKEQGKKAFSKVAGEALSGFTEGIVPPKVGEFVTKKALDKIDKDNQKSFKRIKKKVHNNLSQIKDKINNDERVKKLKEKGKNAVKKVKKVIKAAKVIKFIETYGPIIASAILIFIIIAGVATLAAVIETFLPGIFGDVKTEVDTVEYSKRDQKILEDIEEVVNKYPNVSSAEAANILATVSYPYHELLQDSDVKSYYKSDEDDDEIDKTELLFEDDSNLTASEKYEKYKLIFDKSTDAGAMLFKDWLAEKFGYDLSEDDEEDDGNLNNDMYLTIYRKDKYIDKFDELMKVYSTEGKDGYEAYLKDTYFQEDDGYKKIFKDVSDKDKEELTTEIEKDIEENTDLYDAYIPVSCVTSGGSTTPLNGAGNVENIKGTIYVTLRDYLADSDGTFRKKSYYEAPVLYNTDSDPLTFARYIMGVVYAEKESCLNSESCAKSLMITAKSFAIGRQKGMGYEPEYIESENKTIIHMRGNVGDQDFCDVYGGCKSGRFSKDSWQTFTGEGYKNRKGPLASDKLANLEKWWNEIADQYVVNKESGKFVGNQYDDYNSSCKQGSCVSQTLLKKSSEKETDYMNLLFNSTNGGFDNTKCALYTTTSNELYAVTTGSETCEDGTATASRQKIVDFAKSMVGKIPYYFYEGKSDGYGALGHALSKNFDDNHFGELTTITDHSGRDKYGLDCSGFVDFVFWNAIDNNLGNGNTDTLKGVSTKIEYNELKPGDLGFLNDGSSGTEQHVGIYIGDDKWIELNPNGVTEGPYPDFKVYYRPNILEELDEKEVATQGDGVSTGEMSSPVDGKNLSCLDYPNYSSGAYHGGTDLVVNEGTEVKAMDGGTVITSKDVTSGDCSGSRHCNGGYYSYGRYIEIKHDNGIVTKYAHLSERLVEVGDKVSKGQLIGKSGNTGNSTGAHLHIEVIKDGNNQNPCNYVKK